MDEYFKWYEAGLIDDIAMLGETDIRNKKQIMARKSLYAQLQNTIEELNSSIEDQQGTIQTLQRQVVQAGIKDKIKDADVKIQKATTETTAQQKLIQNIMRSDLASAKKEQVAKQSKK